jgi:hypothetical protein
MILKDRIALAREPPAGRLGMIERILSEYFYHRDNPVSAALHTGSSHEECCFHWRDDAAIFDVASGFGTDFVGYCRLSPTVEWTDGF